MAKGDEDVNESPSNFHLFGLGIIFSFVCVPEELGMVIVTGAMLLFPVSVVNVSVIWVVDR